MSEGAEYTQTDVFRSTPRASISENLTVLALPVCTALATVVYTGWWYRVGGTRGYGVWGRGVLVVVPVVWVRVRSWHCFSTVSPLYPHCTATDTLLTPLYGHCHTAESTVRPLTPLYPHCTATASTVSPLYGHLYTADSTVRPPVHR